MEDANFETSRNNCGSEVYLAEYVLADFDNMSLIIWGIVDK